MVREIDVCIPTYNSEDVIEDSLDSLANSEKESPMDISTIYLIDNQSTDKTREIARNRSAEFGWDIEITKKQCNLPEARQLAISKVNTEWFLFLDDDIQIPQDYLSKLSGAIAPLVGGIQGRKETPHTTHNSNWVRWRSHRSGTHATLLRHSAVEDIEIPNELTVLEDEYIRKHVEENGWLWIYNHQALFQHNNVGRHPINWTEGFLAGKYDLMSFPYVLRGMLTAAIQLDIRFTLSNLQRVFGWIAGWVISKYGR